MKPSGKECTLPSVRLRQETVVLVITNQMPKAARKGSKLSGAKALGFNSLHMTEVRSMFWEVLPEQGQLSVEDVTMVMLWKLSFILKISGSGKAGEYHRKQHRRRFTNHNNRKRRMAKSPLTTNTVGDTPSELFSKPLTTSTEGDNPSYLHPILSSLFIIVNYSVSIGWQYKHLGN